MERKIGIVGWRLGDNSFGVTTPYLEFAQEFGSPRILVPQNDIDDVQAVILPGGLDVSPAYYGDVPAFSTSSTDVFKQFFLQNNLPQYVSAGIPIYGICLGFQQLNVFLGGVLTQNFRYHDQSPTRGVKGHEIFFENMKETLGFEYKEDKQDVNSHHHQGVIRKNLAAGLIPLAHAKNKDVTKDKQYDIIEAFIHKDLKIGGVQYHPEEWNDSFSREIFAKILK